jgi:hypothetical protein
VIKLSTEVTPLVKAPLQLVFEPFPAEQTGNTIQESKIFATTAL